MQGHQNSDKNCLRSCRCLSGLPGSVSLPTAQVDSFPDVKPDDPPLSSIETSSLLLPHRHRSSTVTSVTASSASLTVAPRPTLFEAMTMVPSVTEHVRSSIPQANLLVPDVLPLPTFQDYLSNWADEAADCG